MKINLEDYTIVYNITAVPLVLYSKLVRADEYIKFKDFYIPDDLLSVDCCFSLFDNNGDLVEYSHNVVSRLNVNVIVNNVPLQMIKNLISSYIEPSSPPE